MSSDAPDWREMPCLEWQGKRDRAGYGRMRRDRRYWLVHRLTWAECFGPIPDNLCVLHHCDNPSCRQPLHLFVGTRGDNNRDMAQKGRHVGYRGHRTAQCSAGHLWSAENTYITSAGKRQCRACHARRENRRRLQRRKEHEHASNNRG